MVSNLYLHLLNTLITSKHIDFNIAVFYKILNKSSMAFSTTPKIHIGLLR